ncbi:MAG: PAS domain S-box protein, partial [Gemmatimonadota bacterium]
DSTGEGIYGVDLQGNCTFANPACAKLLGFETVDELLGRQMHELVHHTRPNGEPYPVEECQIYRAFREHRGTHVDDEVMFCSDGKPFSAEYWSYPVERDGALVGCVVTFVDITERRRVEEEMRQTEKMAALGKLSAGLAHELNNPAAAAQRASGQLADGLDELQAATAELTRAGIAPGAWDAVIEAAREFRERADGSFDLSALEASDREEELIGWLEAHGVEEPWTLAATLVNAGVRKDDLDAIADGLPTAALGAVVLWLCRSITVQELTGVVARSTKSISDLVNVVKSYSYMDQAPLQYVDIHDGLEDTLTILGHKLKRGFGVVKQYDRTLPRVQVQGSELNQVWTNLIDNAIGAMGERGTITIRTYRDGEHLVVEIADDGPGIPEKIRSRIFDPFFTTKGVGEGTGLGLDVARRIVTARCGGQIDFSSQPGDTVFRVRLPVQNAGTPES